MSRRQRTAAASAARVSAARSVAASCPGVAVPLLGQRPALALVLDGDRLLAAARWDVASWPDRVHGRARALAAAVSGPAQARP